MQSTLRLLVGIIICGSMLVVFPDSQLSVAIAAQHDPTGQRPDEFDSPKELSAADFDSKIDNHAIGDTSDTMSELKDHLLFFSSFDGTTTANVAKGEAELFTAENRKTIADAKPGLSDPGVVLAVGKGRTGDALEFKSKKRKLIFYKSAGNIAYDEMNFSGAVSFWLQLNPAKDLEPGFCDPIQITDSAYNDAAIWVDFTKENPRDFRLGVIGDLAAWNPNNLSPDDNPGFEKRLIKAKQPDFGRGKWSHVLINFSGLSSDATAATPGKTQFYFDGKLQGELDVADPFTWSLEKSVVMLGLSYIGLMDELAIFDRPLEDDEIAMIFNDTSGLAELLDVPGKTPAADVDDSDPSASETTELIRRATSELIKIQEDDGAWPYEGVYRVGRRIPVGYRVGGTSIVCTSLLYADLRPDSTASIERGVASVIEFVGTLVRPIVPPVATTCFLKRSLKSLERIRKATGSTS